MTWSRSFAPALQGTIFVPLAQAFEVTRSRSQGAVEAVALTMQRLGFAGMIASKPCRERDIVLAMVAARIIAPHTKPGSFRPSPSGYIWQDYDAAHAFLCCVTF
jgi:hypothetical protein